MPRQRRPLQRQQAASLRASKASAPSRVVAVAAAAAADVVAVALPAAWDLRNRAARMRRRARNPVRHRPMRAVMAPRPRKKCTSNRARASLTSSHQRPRLRRPVDSRRDRPAMSNVRHIALVQRAHDALGRALAAARADGGSMSEEFLLADLQDARAALEEISGRRAPEDLLAHIFSRFCIGK